MYFVFVCCFWFPPHFTLGYYFANLYMLVSHVRKEVSHAAYEPCLGITIVSLYCFGSFIVIYVLLHINA